MSPPVLVRLNLDLSDWTIIWGTFHTCYYGLDQTEKSEVTVQKREGGGHPLRKKVLWLHGQMWIDLAASQSLTLALISTLGYDHILPITPTIKMFINLENVRIGQWKKNLIFSKSSNFKVLTIGLKSKHWYIHQFKSNALTEQIKQYSEDKNNLSTYDKQMFCSS